MKFHLGTIFEYSTGYYYGTIIHPFQELYQGNGRSPQGWFLIISMLIIYLKEKGHGVEFKTSITGNEFMLVTMMFFYDRDFTTLGKRNYSLWDEVHQNIKVKLMIGV